MDDSNFSIVAVIVGSFIIACVLWRYLKFSNRSDPVLSTTLILIGFILISSPMWASIVVKGPEWEILLLRENQIEQAETVVQLAEQIKISLPQEKADQITPSLDELRDALEDADASDDDIEKYKDLSIRIMNVTNSISVLL